MTKNGITAGQYVQPVTELIWPELLTPGLNPPPLDFTRFTQLVNGIEQDGVQYGQLSPWPGASAPSAPPACTAAPAPTTTTAPTGTLATPSADAGTPITEIPGAVITLSGSNKNADINSADLIYSWTQVAGPSVLLVGTDKPKCSFTAPTQPSATPIVSRDFKLILLQKTDTTVNNTASTNVKTDKSKKDVVTIDSYTWTTTQGGTLSVTAHSNVVADTSAGLTLFLGTSTTAIVMQSQGGGVFSYSARSTKKPASITVKSTYGGSSTRTDVTS